MNLIQKRETVLKFMGYQIYHLDNDPKARPYFKSLMGPRYIDSYKIEEDPELILSLLTKFVTKVPTAEVSFKRDTILISNKTKTVFFEGNSLMANIYNAIFTYIIRYINK